MWYIPCLAVKMRMLVTPDTDFSNISWNWLCYQRAFIAIYLKYFWKLTLFAYAILLQIWLYTHMPSLVWIVWKTNEILHIVLSVALGVCFSIYLWKCGIKNYDYSSDYFVSVFFYPRLMLMVSCQRYDSSWVQALQLISVLRL